MALPDAYLAEFSEPIGFMDHAAISPLPARVPAAVAQVMARVAAPVGKMSEMVGGIYEASKAAMARLVGAEPEMVTVAPWTSTGMFAFAFGLIGAGGNVVVPSHVFPGLAYPFLRAAAVGGPEVRLVDVADGRVTAAALSDAVDADTRAVAVSLVGFRTGFRVDIGSIRDLAPDALLLVDAVQGLGAVECKLEPADMLVAAGHKWMRAGFGSGVIAVSDRALERLEPTLTGWWGVEGAFDFDVPPPHHVRRDAERFQAGSPAIYGAAAFAAAVEVIEIAGIGAIEAAVLENAAAAESIVRAAGGMVTAPWSSPHERAGIVSFRMPDEEAAATHGRLADAGVACTNYGSVIRLSVHASTGADGLDLLAAAL